MKREAPVVSAEASQAGVNKELDGGGPAPKDGGTPVPDRERGALIDLGL